MEIQSICLLQATVSAVEVLMVWMNMAAIGLLRQVVQTMRGMSILVLSMWACTTDYGVAGYLCASSKIDNYNQCKIEKTARRRGMVVALSSFILIQKRYKLKLSKSWFADFYYLCKANNNNPKPSLCPQPTSPSVHPQPSI